LNNKGVATNLSCTSIGGTLSGPQGNVTLTDLSIRKTCGLTGLLSGTAEVGGLGPVSFSFALSGQIASGRQQIAGTYSRDGGTSAEIFVAVKQ